MKKKKNVYSSPVVRGVRVIQSHTIKQKKNNQGNVHNEEQDDEKVKEDEEKLQELERLKELELKQLKEKELKNARDEGYKKGKSEAENALKEEVEKLKAQYTSSIALLKDAAKQLADKRENVWKESESEIINLILAVSNKIVGYEIEENRVDVIRHVVNDTLSHIGDKKVISVRLSPEDVKKMETLEGFKIDGEDMKIVEDKAISPGGCIVETDFGDVDSQIETRLEEVSKSLLRKKDESAAH